MTKEPIMIDDIDVSECKYLYTSIIPIGNDKIKCGLHQGTTCDNYPNCYYKQLKRKKQECDQLKAKYKTLILEHSGCYRKEWVDEEIRVKKIYEEDRQNYWQALHEIKEIAEQMNDECFYDDFDCKDCDMKKGLYPF